MTKTRKIIALLCFTLSVLINASASNNFSKITLSDGLPSSVVRGFTQNTEGYIFIATSAGLAKYDGYEITLLNDTKGQSLGDVWSIDSNNENSVVIASKSRGLFKYEFNRIEYMDIFEDEVKVTTVKYDNNHQLWVGTDDGIYKLTNENNKIIELKNEKATDFLTLNNSDLLATTDKNIYRININTNKYESIKIIPADQKLNYAIHKDKNENIWLGRENGLYKYFDDCLCFKQIDDVLNEMKVYSLISKDNTLWLGTLYNSLYKMDISSNKLTRIEHETNNIGLSDKTILSLFFDNSGVLWVGTFYSGINYINANSFNFSSFPSRKAKLECKQNNVIQDILELDDGTVWIATENGLVKDFNNKCKSYIHNPDKNEQSLSSNNLMSLSQSSTNDLWITNSVNGLDLLETKTNKISRIGKKFPKLDFYFSIENIKGSLLLGSFSHGLYIFNIQNNTLKKIKSPQNKFDDSSFYYYSENSNNQFYFATSDGVAKLIGEELIPVDIKFKNLNKVKVYALNFDDNNNLWMAINKKYLAMMDVNEKVTDITEMIVDHNKQLKVLSIVPNNEFIWVSTNKGIYKINTKSYDNWLFTQKDGIVNTDFLENSYSINKRTGNIYFGSKNGIVKFKPEDIIIGKVKPNVVLTAFKYFNKKIKSTHLNGEFKLDKPIDELKLLELNYKDYIIGFEFAALDFNDSSRNKYAFRLKGLYDEWNYVDANNRHVTYNNLKSGDYIFQVKASNKDGVWSDKPKELKIKVYPAPWFSPWAYFSYFVIIILSIWAFIRYKTIASRKRAQQLEVTVEERTQEVNLQKKMVETLLDHKNEVFANITHEFKTPLALILGPAEQMVDEAELVKHSDKLNMIQRNAKRLMLMVGQILKLSQAELDKEVIRESQAVQPTLTMLYESFKPLAINKNIALHLENNHQVNVYATAECLEIVIGNLLSNALKFTNSGGEIYISSMLIDNQISISIKDTGTGIDKKDLEKVFKRFVRLDTHKSIQGTGIGLSVVKEITEANDGNVVVNSEWGQGSEFIVTFPVSEIDANEEMSQVMVDQLVSNTDSELTPSHIAVNDIDSHKDDRITVLIIEDNIDMQTHIGNVLKDRFNCLFADRGRDGIALALKEMPDIIICDVMMPGMDGYQVTRILRHDGRTSHIPIILLTALNTKESRIKGWRENIDIYVTKPFDATELNVQLDNILTIRKMLQQKTNKAIKTNDSLNTLDLSEKDLIFIEKFKDVIGMYYTNEYFQKADLASKMAVSERQLQRKIKALIDESPMNMLRDYRLEKAAIKLKDGYQVGLVSDECGFSSVSYFGSCFKKKYGVTPKNYQQLK